MFWYRLKRRIRRVFRNRKWDKDATTMIVELVPTLFAIRLIYEMMYCLLGFKSREEYRVHCVENWVNKTAFVLKPNWIWECK